MSAPFPSDPVQSIGYRPRLENLMTPRGVHIPSWYDPNMHANPSKITVKQGGIELRGVDGEPFTVAEVPIERRWAIGGDGEVLEKSRFREGCHRISIDLYDLRRQENPSIKFEGVIEREPAPAVKAYVSMMVSPEDESRLIPMHYNPEATSGARPEQLASTKGAEIEFKPRIDALLEAYANPTSRAALKPQEIAEVKAHFAGLEAEATVIEPEKPKRKAPMSVAPCGEKVPNFHKKKHMAECEECSKAQ